MPDIGRSGFSPELALVVAALEPSPDGEARARLLRLVEAGPDWMQVAAWAARHGVVPAVWRAVRRAAGGAVPEGPMRRLGEAAEINVARTLMQIAQARRLTRLLAGAGIRSMVIKGPTLSVLAFDDPIARESRDIDFLIDPENVAEADRLIVRADYRRIAPEMALSPAQFATFRRVRCQFAYHAPETGVVLELHWRLFANERLFPLDPGALWSRAEPVRVAGETFATLPDDMLFLYLCVHGSLHVWFRLKWLADVATLLNRMTPDEADRIAVSARRLGAERALRQAAILAQALLGVRAPAALLDAAHADRMAWRAAAAACRAINWRHSPAEPADTRWFNLWVNRRAFQLRPGWRYRARELCHQMWSPEDWARVRLPDRLFFLYPALRPLSWAVRRIRRRAGG